MKNIKNLVFAGIIAIGAVAFFTFGRSAATDAEYVYDGEPEIIAATFESAWCSACKILKPRLAKVIPDFADKPVKFVSLDFTFGQRADIEKQAAAEGLADIYPRFEGATGFTLLVDKDTGEIIDSLTVSYDENAMRAAIAQAVAIASQGSPDNE
ncbi:thioredoxin domain-containing protein [Hyphococcus flavus]|uniref:Thioredoxin domain-containing protein n=1 Tax=Hyphococcus flavus TaxID=1866326 RepID=A0AAF0CFC7_9PROT|nr:thioredoxin domain-containing protein [Hyphococcus flavus]WDI32366.1 thioredoxin domain-containing protein [Hyphococcus flavus]